MEIWLIRVVLKKKEEKFSLFFVKKLFDRASKVDRHTLKIQISLKMLICGMRMKVSIFI